MTLPTFKPNLVKVADPVLADLISQCLSREPKDRPPVARIFKHPFFAGASTGKNAFDFLFGINI
jgi:serine/threonine protein kinase